MKRKGYLYQNICKLENIISAYDEVCRNVNNKRKVAHYKEYKCIYISRIKNILDNRKYVVGPYNVFTIYDPKERRIVSQNIQDKVVNHLVARYIIYPAVVPCLIDVNVASRKNMGTRKGLELREKYQRTCKIKYGTYYILKCDISKFFISIDQQILKNKLITRIKDKEALKILFDIIDSEEKGLGIGSMTSQALAVFYLNDFDHYVKEELKIKYYERYQDDILLFHPSKEYLKQCLEKIREFLKKEKLELNNKSRIYCSNNNFIYLGRKKDGRYANYRYIRKRLKQRYYLYKNDRISLNSFISSVLCYQHLDYHYTNKTMKLIMNKEKIKNNDKVNNLYM